MSSKIAAPYSHRLIAYHQSQSLALSPVFLQKRAQHVDPTPAPVRHPTATSQLSAWKATSASRIAMDRGIHLRNFSGDFQGPL